MNLNEVIREKRTEKQLTQEQLANVLEVSKQTVSNWETGETTPDVETLKKLAVVLEFSIDEALNLEIETKDDLVDWLIIAGMFHLLFSCCRAKYLYFFLSNIRLPLV